jgi:arylsulfatase A-like enzyme
MDLMGMWTGEKPPVERTLFWRNQPHDAARIGNWKYLKENSKEHLFDLTADPGEKTDLKANQTSTFERLRTAYQIWNSQVLPRA